MATITFLEAGGASTGGTQLWNTTTSTWVVDTTVKPVGAYSSLRSEGGSVTAVTIGNAGRLSAYFYRPVAFGSNSIIYRLFKSGANAVSAGVSITTGGSLVITNGTGSTIATGPAVLTLSTWYRISVSYNNNSVSNSLDIKVYLDGKIEVSATGVSTNGNSVIDRFLLAGVSSIIPYYYAHVYADNGTDLTDSGDIRCTAKFPATVNTNDWDTVGGTGAVNERPLDAANYMEQAGASQVNQNYNIQSAVDGDVNVSTSAVAGYMGWAWAKESVVSGTPKLTLNGTDYAVTLTTSPAVYRQCVTSANYPVDAAAIGMVSSGTADDTFLYECGVVVAFTIPPGRRRGIPSIMTSGARI